MSRRIRSFIAVQISEEARECIAALIRTLKPLGGDVKWVRPEGIHITLKFLGDVEEDALEPAVRALRDGMAGAEPFTVSIRGTGAFPNPRNPRVLWVGVEEGGNALKDLAARVERALGSLGFEREKRPFSPHLTIGRVGSPRGIDRIVEAMSSAKYNGGRFYVDETVFMRSDLRPDGAVYTPLHRIQLRGR